MCWVCMRMKILPEIIGRWMSEDERRRPVNDVEDDSKQTGVVNMLIDNQWIRAAAVGPEVMCLRVYRGPLELA